MDEREQDLIKQTLTANLGHVDTYGSYADCKSVPQGSGSSILSMPTN